jgi:two-component system NtrC family sensor kinase
MEEVLHESEERFHMLFESAGDAIIILKDDIIVDCNEKTLTMFGYVRDGLIGQSPKLFSPSIQPDGRNSKEKITENIQKSIQGRPQFFEWKFIRVDETTFDAEVSLARIDIRGETYLQAIIRDVTDRKQTEDELRRLSHAIEQAAEEVIITDTAGFIKYVNPAFQKITGYSRHEAIGQTPRIVKSGAHDDAFYENLWDTIKNGGIWTGHITNRRKDGTLIQEDATISPLVNASGQLTGYVSLKRDITEEVKLQSQLIQAQKMEAIGTLAGGIAHDFNNILTVINGFGTLLQMNVEESNPLRRYVDQILSSSLKAANLTRSLLAFSRKQPITLSPISLNNTIKGTEKLLKRLLTEDIDLLTSLVPEDIIIMADATQIDQILFNLAANARDAMKKGGKLTIETKLFNMEDSFRMLHGFGDPGRYALMSVSDTGCGMDESTREKIFDPFFTTKELGKGTGLGLSTVYGIVKQHNGYIMVSSEPDMGTTFLVYFPVVETLIKEEETFFPVIRGGNETILIAEDDTSVRLLLKETLAKYGYKIFEATDGQDAVEKFKEYSNIDLIILDSVMPRKNGREAYDEIRKIEPLIKTIFMSGYTRDIVLDKGVEEKKVDFVSKPISPDIILKKIREVLER